MIPDKRQGGATIKPITLLSALWALLLAFAVATPAQADPIGLGNEGTYPPFSILGTDGGLPGLEPDSVHSLAVPSRRFAF